ncbi:MAG: hypothetical protein NVSMB17_15750 [Candidatus Dormibacteria bacterium]
MKEVPLLLVRALMGGTAVCLFAVLGGALQPKKFAGLFAAAPAVAVASLGITAASKGLTAVHEDALGMACGAVGMTAYCLASVFVLRRVGAGAGSSATLVLWAAVAGLTFLLVAR